MSETHPHNPLAEGLEPEAEVKFQDPETFVVKLNSFHKVVILIIAVGTVFISVIGGYLVNHAMTEYRLTQVEQKLDKLLEDSLNRNQAVTLMNSDLSQKELRLAKLEVAIKQMEDYGHPDHERRIAKLEVRGDANDSKMQDLTRKIDICQTILERLDRQLPDNSKSKP